MSPGGPITTTLDRVARRASDRAVSAFDALDVSRRQESFRRVVVGLALAGLAVHVLLVLLARTLPAPPAAIELVGRDFLAALYTPFSFILFYEVLLLILSIPQSTTRSLGKQYEILSLIVIRNVFKDISEFETVVNVGEQLDELSAVLLDAAGGLGMFLLVAAFYAIDARRPRRNDADPAVRGRVTSFVRRKKVIALLLSVLLFALASFNLVSWVLDVTNAAGTGTAPTIDVKKIFYLDLFTILVFADAVILILSLQLGGRYPLVFRNAAFVVSTIFLRFSLAVEKPYDVELGLASIAFGTLVLLVYNFAERGEATHASKPAEAEPAVEAEQAT